MDNAFEWLAALLMCFVVIAIFMFGGVLLTGVAIALFCGLVIVATLDIIRSTFQWLSSLFPSKKEKGDGPS